MSDDACIDHWHCDPREACHKCDRPDRLAPCPTCGEAPTIVDGESILRQEHNLAMPEGLSDAGRRAHQIIVAYLKEHDCADIGGKAFYAPAEWVAKGHAYGARSHLVVAYDGGGAVRPVFSMDAAYDLDCAPYQQTGRSREPYALYEGMQEKLRATGLYFEECTGWYSAIYSIDSANSAAEDDA